MTPYDEVFEDFKQKYPSIPITRSWVNNLDVSSLSQVTAEKVFHTWLTTDITKTHPVPQLSEEDLEKMKMDLNKTLTLQIISVINIGCSMYSQLKKLSGKELPSDQDTSFTSQYSREPPSSRLLFLEVTDGVNFFSAMEYQPCHRLSTSILPGTKFQVFRPTIRQEVILLTPDNFKLLGGCVEELRIQNTQERLLRSCLDEDYFQDDDPDIENIPLELNSAVNTNVSSASIEVSRQQSERDVGIGVVRSNTVIDPHCDYKNTSNLTVRTHNKVESMTPQYPGEIIDSGASRVNNLDDFSSFASELFEEDIKSFEVLGITNLAPELRFPVKIRGIISTLCSKLQANPEWTLDLRISDTTGNVEVRFSERVLVSLIGFSSAEFKKLQPKSKSDISLKEYLKKGLESCQKQLRFMTGLFALNRNTITASRLQYEVIEYEKLPSAEEQTLKSAVLSLLNIKPDNI